MIKNFKMLFVAALLFVLIGFPAIAATPVTQTRFLIGRTTTNLANGAVWTSGAAYAEPYGRIVVVVKASHDSAANGVSIEQSGDEDCLTNGSANWDYVSQYTYTATAGAAFSIETVAKCVRVKYTNGGTTSTTLRIYAGLKTF